MKNLNFHISRFEEEFDEEILQKAENLRQQFVEKFPLEKLQELPLERYALGLDDKEESLCWWLEYNTNILGSIRGGSAHKHKIFYSRKKESWQYPDKYENERQAWQALRGELYTFLTSFREGNYDSFVDYELIDTMHMVRNKLLYMYFPEQVLPIYSNRDVNTLLAYFGVDTEEIEKMDEVKANLKLREVINDIKSLQRWGGQKFMRLAYREILDRSQYYKIAPGDGAKYWDECRENGYICIGWDDVGDLSNYADYDEFRHQFENTYDYNKNKTTEKANELWTFFTLEPGDIVIANKGTSKVMGVGEVREEGYSFHPEREEFKHTVSVDWNENFSPQNIEEQKYWAMKTVYEISEDLYKKIKDSDEDNGKEESEKHFTEIEKKTFARLKSNLKRKRNVILYGPPGTGKTYLALRYLKWCKFQDKEIALEDEFVTFHPSFSYEDFIEGYRPVSKEGILDFHLEDGVFKKLCRRAQRNGDKSYYLIIDEINRGDVAKIFGEMITLLEKDKRGQTITLSQSGEEFYVPDNVYIIATMNTSDKSVKMLDAALRRRFGFIECMPEYALIDEPIEEMGLSPADILRQINRELRDIEDREKQIGHSYFMLDGRQVETVEELREAYLYEIIPLVAEYCYSNYAKIGEIIGDDFIDSENERLEEEFLQVNEYFIKTIRDRFGD
ncbi:MAG: AAA family ATPase [Halanaerobiales bacterium]